MASKLNPYLNFDGSCREAMEFYQSVLGGELNVNTFGEYGDEGPSKDGVMHAQLETPSGFTLMASDTPPGMTVDKGAAVSISLSGDDSEELRRFWEGLSEGAEVTMPLEKQMWGDEFGMLTDRFGMQWMVNIAGAAAE
jgi:PhnB protein